MAAGARAGGAAGAAESDRLAAASVAAEVADSVEASVASEAAAAAAEAAGRDGNLVRMRNTKPNAQCSMLNAQTATFHTPGIWDLGVGIRNWLMLTLVVAGASLSSGC